MGLDELMDALKNPKTIRDHPNWPVFTEQTIPRFITFYYTNNDGQEAYWDRARIIKLDVDKMQLIVEGTQGDPLRFDVFKIMHCKNAQSGEPCQDLFFDLIRMWRDTYEEKDD